MTYFPHSWPIPDPGDEGRTSVFADLVTRIGPPWLRRTIARRVMASLTAPLDTIADALTSGIKARFPQWQVGDALAVLGRERGIRRGPSEPGDVYAARLVQWLDAHRGRGGAHTLLRQLRAYHRADFATPIDALSYRGALYTIDGDDITRDVITWGADGSALWAQVWVFLRLPSSPLPLDADVWSRVPRDWTAAHVLRTHVVLLWGRGTLWDYPAPAWATWDERDLALAAVTWDAWDADQPPAIVI